MSVVTYNNVILPYADCDFLQESVYDESGTDWYLTKFDITAAMLVHNDYLPMLAPDLIRPGVSYNAAEIMQVIRTRLETPRKTLSVKFNGIELIPSNEAYQKGTCDAKNGPQPQSCKVPQLTNATFMLSWRVIAHYWEKNLVRAGVHPPAVNLAGSPILYNRWTESVEYDNCMFERRTRDGKYVIRSDNRMGLQADAFRDNMAPVMVLPGFLRESSKYTVTADGLGIQYTVTDRQVFKYPPDPAYDAKGTYTEYTSKHGSFRYGEVHLRLKGSPITDQARLIAVALSICSRKLRLNGVQIALGGNGDPLNSFASLEHCIINVEMYDNEIDVRMKARMLPARNTTEVNDGVWQLDFKKMASTPGGPGPKPHQPAYPVKGIHLPTDPLPLMLQAAAYNDPSILGSVIDPNTNQLSKGLVPGQAGEKPEK